MPNEQSTTEKKIVMDPVTARTKYPASFKNPWSIPGVVGNITRLTADAVSIDNKLTATEL